jgi:hypothetical protein
MISVDTNEVLNRLMLLHRRSLPMYLNWAQPWSDRGDQQAQEALSHIVADQQYLVDRIATLILDNNGVIDPGEFPLVYTGYHDLSLDYLLQKMIAHQKQDIEDIEECVDMLRLAPMAKSVAEESLGAAKGHLESLEELVQEPSAAK